MPLKTSPAKGRLFRLAPNVLCACVIYQEDVGAEGGACLMLTYRTS